MKTRIVIFLILFAVLIISCNSYGTKLEYQKTEVYFIDKVDKKDAEKLNLKLQKSKKYNYQKEKQKFYFT